MRYYSILRLSKKSVINLTKIVSIFSSHEDVDTRLCIKEIANLTGLSIYEVSRAISISAMADVLLWEDDDGRLGLDENFMKENN